MNASHFFSPTWVQKLKYQVCALVLWAAAQHCASAQQVSISDTVVSESAGSASVVVSLSQPAASAVSVNWATSNYSASAGSDFIGASGTLTIPAGATEGIVSVALTDDALPEIDETFDILLTNPVNATLADDRATVTISWNDMTALSWDGGATDAGSEVYTHPNTNAGSPVFRIIVQSTTVGGWRSALKLTSGEAHLYLSRGSIPDAGSCQFKSERTGSDGIVLAADQFNAGEVWYLRVVAQAGASWSLVTGEVFVQNLGSLGYSDSNSDGGYDIGEAVVPVDSGTVAIGAEGMRFFRVSVPSGTPAWSVWLNGDSREVAARKNQVPFHDSTNRHDRKQAGNMLVVPTYLGSDLTTFFLSVTGAPGSTVRLDTRIQQVLDIAHNSTLPPETVSGVPYRVYRLQMPVDQLAWEVTVNPLAGNPNVALRFGDVPSEFVNDAFSEAPGTVSDSATMVPPALTDGAWFITVYGTAPYQFTLTNGIPQITPMDFYDTVTNNLTGKAGWRYYAVTDIGSQTGSLGWELLLSAQVPGTEIAIRRNAVPGRWSYRTMSDGPATYTNSNGHVDASSLTGWLQHPAHQADVWYVGVYTPGAALGSFQLTTREITPTAIAFTSSATAITDQPEGIWRFFRVVVPAGALGLDVWAKDVTSGDPQVVVRRDILPNAVTTASPGWWVDYATTWTSGNSWTSSRDWSAYVKDPNGSDTYNRRLVAAMGRPLEAGTYCIGVYNNAGAGVAAYTLLSRGIGADGSGYALEAVPLAFAGGNATITGLAPRDERFFKISIPANTRSWQVKLSQTTGELLLLACKDTVPNIQWSEGADVIVPWANGSVGMSKSGDEIYHLLPQDGADYLVAGDYYLTVVSQGVSPGQPNWDHIGTGNSSGTLQSVGQIPVTNLGTASETTTVQADTLQAGEIKLYQINVPANTSVLEVVADNRVGNPRVSVVAGQAAPQPNERFYSGIDSYGWDYGRTTGRVQSEESATGNNPDVATIPSPPPGLYTIAVRANPVDNSDDAPDPASFNLKVTAVGTQTLAFAGENVAVSGQLEGAWRFFRVVVPAGALGLDVWAKDVTSGDPQVVVRRDVLPTAVATAPDSSWMNYATTWPSGYSLSASRDWSTYVKDPNGSDTYNRRLVAAMGRPLEPGTYCIGVYNNAGDGVAAYSLLSRGIGADGSGYALEAVPLAFAGGNATVTALAPRDGRFFKVSVPANTRSWQVKLSQTTGELLLLARKDTVPNIQWGEGDDVMNTYYGSVGMSKSGDEIYHLLPQDGAEYLVAGDYYLTVVSQGENPGQPNSDRIGTGTSSGTLQSVGQIPVTNLGTASETTTMHADTLQAGEIKLYQISVPANTSVLEVVADNRVGNPRVSVVAGQTAPQPNASTSAGYYGDDPYGWDYGRTTGRFRSEEYATGNNPDVATIPSPPPGIYTIAVRANPIDNSDAEPDPASFNLMVTAVGTLNLAFASDSVVVSGQLEGAWRFFRVVVPAGALGLDVWAKNVTSGDPQVVVRRDILPAAVGSSLSSSATTWPSGSSWSSSSDWSVYSKEPNGSNTGYRRLVAAMGRPLEPGTYCIGVYNNAGAGVAAYTLLSRGIGANGSGCALEAVPLDFAGGNATITGLAPRDGRFFKVSIPANTRSWQVKLSQTSGELLLLARKGTVPNIQWNEGSDVMDPYNGSVGMAKSGDEIYHLLPQDGADYLVAGDYYLTVVSQGVNPGQPNADRIGTGTSSGTLQSIGQIPVTNLGTASSNTIIQPDTLQAGEIKLYQINVPANASVLEVVADNRVGNPRVSVVAGQTAPQPNEYYHRNYSDIKYTAYGWDYGRSTGRFYNSEYATGNNPDVATIPSPASGFYTIAVRANPIDYSNSKADPASFNLKVRTRQIIPLNLDAALNGSGGNNTATSQLFNQQTDYYSVTVPADILGQPVAAWRLGFTHAVGDTRFRISTSFSNWSNAITITGNNGVIVPPFLTAGTTYYIAVIGDQTANYTLTSSALNLMVPSWTMPVSGNVQFGDSGTGLPGDQGRDLANGTWDFYAVDVPIGNSGLLRTVLEEINGDPDLYIREDGVPTLDHGTNGTSGSLYHRSMTQTTTQYGNWVPWDGRTERQLRAGRWYLGVKADGTSNARYRLRVSTGTVTELPLDGASVSNQILGGGDWRYYRVTVPVEAPLGWSVTFAQQQGDVVMHIRDTLPPGCRSESLESFEPNYLNASDDNKNQGPYEYSGYDAPGTHLFSVPWLRPGHVYYLGMHAKNDATFSLGTATSGTIGDLPLLDFYTGTVNTTLSAGQSTLYRIPVPTEATRMKWVSTLPSTVQLRMEQGTLPSVSGTAQHYVSSGANVSLNQALSATTWPWVPGQSYYLRIVNNGTSDAAITLTMNGKNALTEDEDTDGLADAWELTYFGTKGWGGANDNDNDGSTNTAEFADGTNPTDPASAKYALTLLARNGSAAANPVLVKYDKGAVVGITATSAPGYDFVGWSGGPFRNDDFALKATGTITIPVTGTWTFGAYSDEGVRLKIGDTTVINDTSTHTPQDTFGQIALSAGTYPLELIYFERTGGECLELFAALGSFTVFNDGFKLVGDTGHGGLALESLVAGVPTPGFSVRQAESLSNAISNIGNADTLLQGGYPRRQDITVVAPVLNFQNHALNAGHFEANVPFPLCSGSRDNPATVTMNGNYTLTAMNSIPLAVGLDTTDLVWNAGESAPWLAEMASSAHDGSDSAVSGPIDDGQISTIETTVEGPGVLTFWWKASSESGYDKLNFQIDTSYQHSISGEAPWAQKTYNIAAGTHTLRWKYEKNSSVSAGADCAWVDEVIWTPTRYTLTVNATGGSVQRTPDKVAYLPGEIVTLTVTPAPGFTFSGWTGDLSGAANPTTITMSSNRTVTATFTGAFHPDDVEAGSFSWTTGGNAPWLSTTGTTHDGTDAARSGVIGNSQNSWLETTVTLRKEDTLRFWWKVSSEGGYDPLRLTIDGVPSVSISGEVNWEQRSVVLAAGTHVIRWTYGKDGSVASGQDAAWLDEVSFDAHPSPYDAWAIARGLAGNDASPTTDSDADGANNLLEFACNLNPALQDARILQPGSETPGLPSVILTGTGSGARLRIEFLARRNAGLTYTAQFASGLSPSDWLPLTGTVTPINDEWERVVVEDTETIGTSPRRFGRVLVTLQ